MSYNNTNSRIQSRKLKCLIIHKSLKLLDMPLNIGYKVNIGL